MQERVAYTMCPKLELGQAPFVTAVKLVPVHVSEMGVMKLGGYEIKRDYLIKL